MPTTPSCAWLVVGLVLRWHLSSAGKEKVLYRWPLKEVDFVVNGIMFGTFHIQMERTVVEFVYKNGRVKGRSVGQNYWK